MSTSPDISPHAADRLVSVLSHWLAGHVRDEQLRAEVERVGTDELGAEQAEAVAELLVELRDPDGHAGELNMLVRETIQALAFGV
jgi:hypothetical protein